MSNIKFPNEAAKFVFYRSYARWIDDEQKREDWEHAVDRYIDFILNQRGEKIPSKVLNKIRSKILSFDVMPSMRALWSAGDAANFDNLCMYNCSFSAVDCIEAFSEAVYILMCGTGFGYSVEKKYVDKLPIVPKLDGAGAGTWVIPDSKAGWADSVKVLIEWLYKGHDIEFDYSLLRPKGAKLKVMGGKSSGPSPLIVLHKFIREVFSGAQGRKLTSLECSDIMNQIAEIVVVGGVRRSSEICLSDLDDEPMSKAKTGQFPIRRYMSNNSAVYNKKPTATEFLNEWSILANSGTGERGIFNLSAAKHTCNDRRDSKLICGLNPCSEILLRNCELCVAGNTQLITRNGVTTIENAVGKEIEIWNGIEWAKVIPRLTRKNTKLLRVEISDGSYLDCTPDHKFSVKDRFNKKFSKIEAKDLLKNHKYAMQSQPFEIQYEDGIEYPEAYTLGFAVGDGCSYNGRVAIDLFGNKIKCPVSGSRRKIEIKKGYSVESCRVYCPSTIDADLVLSLKNSSSAFDIIFSWSKNSILQFIAGLLDSDGSNVSTGGIRLYLSDRERAEKIQLLLTKCGIRSSICLMQKAGTITNFGIRNRDMFYLQITSCNMIPCNRLNVLNGHLSIYKSKYQTIRSVVEIQGEHDAYCFEEKNRHMAVFNNVLTYQCNLSEVVVRASDDLDDILEKIETAVWIGAIQSTFTSFPYLRKQWKKNCEEERLLGVSLTGQMDNYSLLTEDALRAMKSKAIKVAKHASRILGINMPAAITCVKPSGSVSQVVNSSSGIHTRFAKYYLRRYRIASTDPLYKLMKAAGFKSTPENGQHKKDWDKASKGNRSACNIYEPGKEWSEDKVTTWVVSFPIKSPPKSLTRNDLTAIQQLEFYKKVQTNWCEHNVSNTIYVKDEEWFEVGNWVYKNWDIVNGLSFLPFDGGTYEQAPYEEITKEEYEKLISILPTIDYDNLRQFENEDNTTGAKSYACTGDRCELK